MNKNFKIIIIFLLPIFLYSCQTAKDALQGKKRSEQSDEFLVEKKNPLALPPDYEKLPSPSSEEEDSNNQNKSSDIKDLLVINQEGKSENSNSEKNCDPKTAECKKSDIESSILKKIQ